MSVYELARLYYPRLWDKSRIEALVGAGRLSAEEAARITGEGIAENAAFEDETDGE